MQNVIETLRAIARRHRDLRTLAALDDRALSDLGINREQALHLASMPKEVAGRVQVMARVFGADPHALQQHRDLWTGLVETCAECGALPACRVFMDEGGSDAASARGFCPNAPAFAQAAR